MSITLNGTSGITTAGLTLSTGNLVIGTAGNGIDFSAASHASGMTSELLNDYEEGTWTPVFQGNATAGVFVYGFQVGNYTKVGNMVMATFTVTVNSVTTGATGEIFISGLPFLSKNASGVYRAPGAIANTRGLNFNGTAGLLEVGNSVSHMVLYGFNNNASYNTSDAASIGVADFVNGSIIYQTA